MTTLLDLPDHVVKNTAEFLLLQHQLSALNRMRIVILIRASGPHAHGVLRAIETLLNLSGVRRGRCGSIPYEEELTFSLNSVSM